MAKTAAIIMAAGNGSEIKSAHAKTVQKVSGEPMIKMVYRVCREAGIKNIVAVVGHMREEVMAALGNDVCYAVQEQLASEGDACKKALQLLDENIDDVIVLPGNTPLIRGETIKKAIQSHNKNKRSVTVFTAREDACSKTHTIAEISSGMYCFQLDDLKNSLEEIMNNNAQEERCLTDVIRTMAEQGKRVGAYTVNDSEEILSANDMYELSRADKILRIRINKGHALNGVYFQDIENAFVSWDVVIEPDAQVLKGCMLEGNTVIKAGAVVGPDSHIVNTFVGENVIVQNTVAVDSVIGDGSKIGPFAYLRPKSIIGKNCKVGDFVEIKNAVLGDGTKASHLTYIGDGDVGSGVNFGCGTVVVNYDGMTKFRTKIGNDAFVGCNSNLISPVNVGDGAYIAAGSTITEDVPEKTLAIARARQVIKENWKDKRKE